MNLIITASTDKGLEREKNQDSLLAKQYRIEGHHVVAVIISDGMGGEVKGEIYGRHGYIYKKKVWYDYFIQKTWYKPSIPADSFSDSFLSSTELSNVKLLLKYYEDMDYPDY